MNWRTDKRLLLFLLPMVLAIWGVVIWRVFSGLKQPDFQSGHTSNKSQPSANKKIVTRTLSLEYTDPFVVTNRSNSIPSKSITPTTKPDKPNIKNTAPSTPINNTKTWPAVRYMGLIKNLSTGKQSVLLQLENQSEMVTVGSNWNDFTVIKGEADSVLLKYEKEKKWIKK